MGNTLNFNPGQNQDSGQQQQLNIDLATLKNIRCLNCNNQVFQPLFIIKKLSALQSPSGKGGSAPIQIFACTNCGAVPIDFGGNLIEKDDEPIKKITEENEQK